MAHIIREWSWIVVFHCFINLKLGKSLIAKSPTKKVPPNPKKQSLSESNVMKMSGHFGWFQIMFHWSHDLKSPKTPEPALALDSETFVLQVLQETNTEPKLQLFRFKEIMITVCQSKGYGKNHPKNQVKKPSLPSALDAVRTEPSQKVLQRLTPWFDNKDEASSYRMVKQREETIWISRGTKHFTLKQTAPLEKTIGLDCFLGVKKKLHSGNSKIPLQYTPGFHISRHPQTHQMNTSRNLENHQINIIFLGGQGG